MHPINTLFKIKVANCHSNVLKRNNVPLLYSKTVSVVMSAMKYWNRIKLMKVKKVFFLTVVLTFILISVTLFYHGSWILSSTNYKLIPADFVKKYDPNNESYCTFNYNLPEEFVYEEYELEYSPQMEMNSPYRVLYNVVEAKENVSSLVPVTYATHATAEFVNYISEIARYWEGPVSVAVFVPDFDADTVTKQLVHLCHCLPDMSKVSVHYVFPANDTPFVQTHPYLYFDSTYCAISKTVDILSFRASTRLKYPINVCRNVARNAAATYFVMVSDIQLIPSEKLASKFIEMVSRYHIDKHQRLPSRVYVLPLFEVERDEVIPRSKTDLIRLVRNEKAVYFHRHVCSHCQRFPGLEKWLAAKDPGVVKPFLLVAREYPFHRWEPIYIGTRHEPYYSELLSWEGKQDKMIQMLEMCLMGYKFVILDGGFLVHWPGIKKKAILRSKNKHRTIEEIRNSRQYKAISNDLVNKYHSDIKYHSECKP